MSTSEKINVGILGFGTVGQGTWKHLSENSAFWKKILGVELVPKRASVRDLNKPRKISIPVSYTHLTLPTKRIV